MHLVGKVLAGAAARHVDVVGVGAAGVREQSVGKSRYQRPLVGRKVITLGGAQRNAVVLSTDRYERRRRRNQHKVCPRHCHG